MRPRSGPGTEGAGDEGDIGDIGDVGISDVGAGDVDGGEDPTSEIGRRSRVARRQAGRGVKADAQRGIVIRPDPSRVRDARNLVAECCAQAACDEELTATAVLLASELVTNAFTHGRSEARVQVTASTTRVRVEVGDDNSRLPTPVALDADALDGRGLTIVAMLSARWGVQEQEIGKTVWFELIA